MIDWFTSARLIACLVVAVSAWTWHVVDRHKAVSRAETAIHGEYAAKAAQAEAANRVIEQQRAAKALEARHAYIQREKVARADADAARSELDGLRAALANRREGSETAGPGPGADGARVRELLSECAAVVQGLAATSDRLAGKVTGLQRYITDQCPVE